METRLHIIEWEWINWNVRHEHNMKYERGHGVSNKRILLDGCDLSTGKKGPSNKAGSTEAKNVVSFFSSSGYYVFTENWALS